MGVDMPRVAKQMSALDVSRLSGEGLHAVGGVAGLYLQIDGNSRSWILRIKAGDTRRSFGLGAYPGRSLADARKKAQELRDQVKAGIDPLGEKKAAQSAMKASQAKQVTFRQVAEQFLEAKAGEKTARHTQVWRSSFEMFAYPVIGDVLVQDIELPQVVKILEPIWICVFHANWTASPRQSGQSERSDAGVLVLL
jgi:hypothetical protein